MNKEEDDDIIGGFITVIDILIERHKQDELYYSNDPIWSETKYYANMTFYSPSIRSKILNHEMFEPTAYDEIHLALLRFYTLVTGYTPPPWFHKNRTWLSILCQKMKDTDAKKKAALLSLLYKCTSYNAQNVVSDARDILLMEEYKTLKETQKDTR